MSDKINIIRLFKRFISNKDYQLLDTMTRYREKENTGYYERTTYQTRKHIIYTLNGDDYSYPISNKDKSKLNYPFADGGRDIRRTYRFVKLILDGQPPIILKENITPKLISNKKLTIVHNGFMGSWFGEKVTEYIYEEEITRTIEFGSIKINLDEDECKELFEFYDEHQKVRQQHLDRVKLKEQIKKYW